MLKLEPMNTHKCRRNKHQLTSRLTRSVSTPLQPELHLVVDADGGSLTPTATLLRVGGHTQPVVEWKSKTLCSENQLDTQLQQYNGRLIALHRTLHVLLTCFTSLPFILSAGVTKFRSETSDVVTEASRDVCRIDEMINFNCKPPVSLLPSPPQVNHLTSSPLYSKPRRHVRRS